MRHVPVRRQSQASGCRRTVIILLVLLLSTTACLLLGIAGGMLAGKLALPEGVFLARNTGKVDRTPSSSPPTPMPLPVETPVSEDGGSGPAAPSPESLLASELPAGEEPSLEEPPLSEEPAQGVEVTPEVQEAPASAPVPAPVGQEQQSAATPFPGLPASAPSTPATRLVIPSLGVDAAVVVLPLRDGTWDVSHLTQDVGHLQGTASPGEDSNVALAGHVTLAQGGYGPFKDLAQLKTGDEIEVYASSTGYRYVVETVKVVAPQDVEITYPSDRPLLTLITCANWDRSDQRYLDRVAAVAYLAE